jgi:hypothetical protein
MGKVLPRLTSDEGASVQRSLLDRHPELVEEAEEIARARMADVNAGAVADEVEQAVLDLDADELGTRAGRTRWGYVEPTDAAWELGVTGTSLGIRLRLSQRRSSRSSRSSLLRDSILTEGSSIVLPRSTVPPGLGHGNAPWLSGPGVCASGLTAEVRIGSSRGNV